MKCKSPFCKNDVVPNRPKNKIYCSTKCQTRHTRTIAKEFVQNFKKCCEICGYKKCPWALTFHHKNPKMKKFNLRASGLTRSIKQIKEELDKCICLCANCHAELHYNEFQKKQKKKNK